MRMLRGRLENYHSRLDFLDAELVTRGTIWEVDRAHVVYVHQQRNKQYHGGNKGTPERSVLALARRTALWVFGLCLTSRTPRAVWCFHVAHFGSAT